MNAQRYLNVILTVIAILLLVSVLARATDEGASGFSVVRPAYAVTQQSVSDWVFFPVGNQGVRRLVIWDKSTNTVYDYKANGKLDNTWVITAPGEPIEKL